MTDLAFLSSWQMQLIAVSVKTLRLCKSFKDNLYKRRVWHQCAYSCGTASFEQLSDSSHRVGT